MPAAARVPKRPKELTSKILSSWILSLKTAQRTNGSFETSLRFEDMFTRTMKYLKKKKKKKGM